MRGEVFVRWAALLVFTAVIATSLASPYVEEDDVTPSKSGISRTPRLYVGGVGGAKKISISSEDGLEELDDYYNNNPDRLIQQTEEKRGSRIYTPMRRSCIRRGGNCDHQHENCCYNSTCRCNLWGSNCRCQRMGLFQKWGK